MSLLLPGLGQLYCGKVKRGVLTLLFFLAGAGLTYFLIDKPEPAGLFGGMGLRLALVLYVFSFLDAYFTARDINLGLDAVQPYNPRVAAVLNLVTRGFGYWYVDEKTKGVVLFFLVGAADRASMKMEDPAGIWLSLAVEVAMAVMAADAYRIARLENSLAVASPPVRPEGLEPEEGLKPAIPLALASLFVAAYMGLILLAIYMPDYEKVDQSQAVVSVTPDGSMYANPKYGVQLHVPAGWELDHKSDPAVFVDATATEGGCSLSLIPDSTLPFVTAESIAQDVIAELRATATSLEMRGNKPSELAGAPAHEVAVHHEFEGVPMDQTYVIARKGLSLFLLVITETGAADDPCRTDVAQIRQRVVLPD
jgi:hypothetical protein